MYRDIYTEVFSIIFPYVNRLVYLHYYFILFPRFNKYFKSRQTRDFCVFQLISGNILVR